MRRTARTGLAMAVLIVTTASLPAAASVAPGLTTHDTDAAPARAPAGGTAGRVTAAGGAAAASRVADKPLWRQARDYWTTLAAPRIERRGQDPRIGDVARPHWFRAALARHHTGFPPAARELARREAIAARSGQSPRAVARQAGAPPRQQARC